MVVKLPKRFHQMVIACQIRQRLTEIKRIKKKTILATENPEYGEDLNHAI